MDSFLCSNPVPTTEEDYPSIFKDDNWLNIEAADNFEKYSCSNEFYLQVEESPFKCNLSPPTSRLDSDALILTSNPEQLPFYYNNDNCKSTLCWEQPENLASLDMDAVNHIKYTNLEPVSKLFNKTNESETHHKETDYCYDTDFKTLSVALGHETILFNDSVDLDDQFSDEEPLVSPRSDYCIPIESETENKVKASLRSKRRNSKVITNVQVVPSRVSGIHRRFRKRALRLTDYPEEKKKILQTFKNILPRTYDAGNKLRIHHFIIDILTSKDINCKQLYIWEDRKKLIFRIAKPDIVQTIYHHIKGNKKGDYETFGRALRHAREKNQYFAPSPTSNKKIYQLSPKSVHQYHVQFGYCDLIG